MRTRLNSSTSSDRLDCISPQCARSYIQIVHNHTLTTRLQKYKRDHPRAIRRVYFSITCACTVIESMSSVGIGKQPCSASKLAHGKKLMQSGKNAHAITSSASQIAVRVCAQPVWRERVCVQGQ